MYDCVTQSWGKEVRDWDLVIARAVKVVRRRRRRRRSPRPMFSV